MPSEAYERLDRQWKSTCKLILGIEPGGLKDYGDWLSSHMRQIKAVKSQDGQELMYHCQSPQPGAKMVAFGSVDFMKRHPPLSANDMKDIDSIAAAIGDRAAYAGNISLGNSRFVEGSTNVIDSTYVYRSACISESSYVAYATDTRLSKMIFGGDQNAQSEQMMAGFINRKGNRCIEAWACDAVSDIYYSSYLQGCTECMFCFNLTGQSHCVGNCALPKEKYLEVKKRLLDQLAGELERKKSLPMLSHFVPPLYAKPAIRITGKPEGKKDMAKIEKEFTLTAKLVLGVELFGIDRYSKWLSKDVLPIGTALSALSGREIHTPGLLFYEMSPKDRLIGVADVEEAGRELKLPADEAATLCTSNARERIGKIAFFCCERMNGSNTNNILVPLQVNASNCYHSSNIPFGKDCAYCTWPRNSEHCYGSARVFESAFAIRCFNSQKLSRCIELDNCRECTGSYFLHNCENVHDSMFCFNVKNLKYAIGNAEVGKEAFEKAKMVLLAEIATNLDKTGDCKRSIYNIAGNGN